MTGPHSGASANLYLGEYRGRVTAPVVFLALRSDNEVDHVGWRFLRRLSVTKEMIDWING